MKDHKGEHPFGDAGQIILTLIFLTVWAADSFVLHISAHWAGDIPLIIRLSGCLLLGIPAWILFRSGHQAVRDEERPVRVLSKGAFHYVRHPLYLSSLLVCLAVAFSTASVLAFGFLIMNFIFYNFIAAYEENIMEARFGEVYLSYKKRTGRWIPRIFQPNVQKSG